MLGTSAKTGFRPRVIGLALIQKDLHQAGMIATSAHPGGAGGTKPLLFLRNVRADFSKRALPPFRPGAGLLRMLLQRFVGLEIRLLAKLFPHQLHGIIMTASAMILVSGEFTQPAVGASRECF